MMILSLRRNCLTVRLWLLITQGDMRLRYLYNIYKLFATTTHIQGFRVKGLALRVPFPVRNNVAKKMINV